LPRSSTGTAGAGDHTSRSRRASRGNRREVHDRVDSQLGACRPVTGNVLAPQSHLTLAARGIMSESGTRQSLVMLIARSSARRAISTWAEETRLGRVETAWHLSEHGAHFGGCRRFRGDCRCRACLADVNPGVGSTGTSR